VVAGDADMHDKHSDMVDDKVEDDSVINDEPVDGAMVRMSRRAGKGGRWPERIARA
jgi:hypothetical protein